MAESVTQRFKQDQIQRLPDKAGVYALCDLDEQPIYVGQATESRDTSIRKRVQRHLTSARSDIVANRQIDVWEIAFVWAWVVPNRERRLETEAYLYHQFDRQSPLVNGTVPQESGDLSFKLPRRHRVQIMRDSEVDARQDPSLRFPRQIQHFNALVDYILNTQDKKHLRRAIDVHFDRLSRYRQQFLGS